MPASSHVTEPTDRPGTTTTSRPTATATPPMASMTGRASGRLDVPDGG